jgi:hypothetical protein
MHNGDVRPQPGLHFALRVIPNHRPAQAGRQLQSRGLESPSPVRPASIGASQRFVLSSPAVTSDRVELIDAGLVPAG